MNFRRMIKGRRQKKSNRIRIWRDKTNINKLGVTKRTKSLKSHEPGLASDQDILFPPF